MKYELLVVLFVLYQVSIGIFMWRWVSARQDRLARLVRDKRLASPQRHDPSVLTHTKWRRTAVLAIVILMIGLVFIMVLDTGPSVEEFSWPWFMVGVVIIFGLGWAPWGMVAEAYGIAYVLDHNSITRLSPWSRERTIIWNDVLQISYSSFWSWFTVGTSQGSIHVTTVIGGLEQFALAMVSRVPRDRIRLPDQLINKALQGPFRF